MSIQTTALKYGWSIVAGVVLTGATIFTAESTLKSITQRDAIQVILGTVERCLATQTGTNTDGTAIYAVAPPSFVRSWVSTNGLTGTNFAWVTNQVTNSISWYTDRAMMVDLDAKIFALVPYYVNTNTVYDGTTNIVLWTATNLFATLGIGDHTNKFTAIPCWTNNAGATNATTNAATFGPWAWRNYRVAWQERYKVLNALKMTAPVHFKIPENNYRWSSGESTNSFEEAMTIAVNNWTTNYSSGQVGYDYLNANAVLSRYSSYYDAILYRYMARYYVQITTNILSVSKIWVQAVQPQYNSQFDGQGDGMIENAFIAVNISGTTNGMPLFAVGQTNTPPTSWPSYPTNETLVYKGYFVYPEYDYWNPPGDIKATTDWQFNYATNKYW